MEKVKKWALWLVVCILGVAVVTSVALAVNGFNVTNNFYSGSYADQRTALAESDEAVEIGEEFEELIGVGEGRGLRYPTSYVYAGYGFFADGEDGFD